MSYLKDLEKFYTNFALWRMKTLRLGYQYLLLLSNSSRMRDDFLHFTDAARDFVNNTHIRDESQIWGSVWFFNNNIVKNDFSDNKNNVLKYLDSPPARHWVVS